MKPCIACGACDRYEKSGRCRPCVQRRAGAWAAANKERRRLSNRQWRKDNISTARDRAAKWRAENGEHHRNYERNRKGLPVPTRPCPDACENCDTPAWLLTRSLALDHCHETGKFRGWLCSKCNASIGGLGDNEDGLLRAVAYLRRAA